LKLEKKTVVCFGDSNTFGWLPTLSRTVTRRYGPDRRWPGVLAKRLGAGYQVIEEGLVGRTTVHEDPIDGPHKNGRIGLAIALETHMPIDIVIIMLGTNDYKFRFSAQTCDIVDSLEVLVNAVKGSGCGPGGRAPRALLVAPPPLKEVGRFGEMFAGAAAKSAGLGEQARDLAKRADISFLDAGKVIEVSAVDGIHLDQDAHRDLGVAVAEVVKSMGA
jgi:lysophospholipase L1-like esterase